MVYFHGRPVITLTLVYFHGRPTHKCSSWFIFKGDRPTHLHWSVFTGVLPTYTHFGLFKGDLPFWLSLPKIPSGNLELKSVFFLLARFELAKSMSLTLTLVFFCFFENFLMVGFFSFFFPFQDHNNDYLLLSAQWFFFSLSFFSFCFVLFFFLRIFL